jgi:hypothetical protein
VTSDDLPPLYRPQATAEPSVFRVEALLREARRQRRLPEQPVPQVCLLDPDGDLVRHLARSGHATRFEAWACYHSELWLTACGGLQIGVVPCAVGAPYAVLVAEELHASGCNLVISVTSAGQILPTGDPPASCLSSERGATRAPACTTSRRRNGPNCAPNSASG